MEETEELSQMSEGNSQSQTSLSRSRSVSQVNSLAHILHNMFFTMDSRPEVSMMMVRMA